jgi:hypothetical protein
VTHRKITAAASLAAVLLFLLTPAGPAAEDRSTVRTVLLGKSYPLEFQVSYHAALFHWVDSLAGTSGGKTVAAHQREYAARLGNPTATETKLLDRFRRARVHDARQPTANPDDDAENLRGGSALRRTFLDAPDLVSALESAELEVDPEDMAALRETFAYFGPKYEAIWQDGQVPVRFLSRFANDPKRVELESLLARITGFFDTDLSELPRPTVVLAPVPTGYGTHATAIGPYLLIEVRPPDRLRQQASVIVHENSHFLFINMNPERRRRIEAFVASSSERTREAWETLHEALPTAIGQGVADRIFRPRSWSKQQVWYHTRKVDAYAKALYPLVRKALDSGEPFDKAFLKQAIEVYPF